MKRFLFFMFLASFGFVSSARSKAIAYFNRDLTTTASVDLERYAGRWYEIARLPNCFERADMSNITADYDMLPSGEVVVCNAATRGNGREVEVTGIARALDDTNTKLSLSFAPGLLRIMPFVWSDYWIIERDENYQWSLVGEPTRRHLWILSRQPEISEDLYRSICNIALEKGFDVTDLIRPLQRH